MLFSCRNPFRTAPIKSIRLQEIFMILLFYNRLFNLLRLTLIMVKIISCQNEISTNVLFITIHQPQVTIQQVHQKKPYYVHCDFKTTKQKMFMQLHLLLRFILCHHISYLSQFELLECWIQYTDSVHGSPLVSELQSVWLLGRLREDTTVMIGLMSL